MHCRSDTRLGPAMSRHTSTSYRGLADTVAKLAVSKGYENVQVELTKYVLQATLIMSHFEVWLVPPSGDLMWLACLATKDLVQRLQLL